MSKITYSDERAINQKATAANAKALRKSCGLSMKAVATGMGISQPHVFYLETAQRNWTEKLFKDYVAACESLALDGGKKS